MNRILIAEDEVRIASFLEKGLRANGFTTTAVHDGASALRHARTGEHDLLILDLGLPDMTDSTCSRSCGGRATTCRSSS